jgi:hypothetical protein
VHGHRVYQSRRVPQLPRVSLNSVLAGITAAAAAAAAPIHGLDFD